MPKPILNVADVELRRIGHGADALRSRNAPEPFQAHVGEIGRRIGARKLGYNLTVVPPGTPRLAVPQPSRQRGDVLHP